MFFLELLSAVQSRVVDLNMVKKGEDGLYQFCIYCINSFHEFNLFTFMVPEEEQKLNATYIISVARKLGCTVFLLPEDIMEVIKERHHICIYKLVCHNHVAIIVDFHRNDI